ncbi:MAG TPA: NAD(P)-dependent oxidoreductase [Sunxiuqinia sp.]|nr:NAD(P)-dependent oxidoreductase [Sunxiuqinia sp.]
MPHHKKFNFMKVTFIGLGIMGQRMATNLLKNKVDLTVFNRSPEPVEQLAKMGATAAKSYVEAVRGADIVFTMLSAPDAVKQVMFGDNGCLKNMKKDALWADCSTVNPSFSIESNKEAEKHGIRFMDTPVAGSKIPAEKAELVFVVGGNEQDIKEIESLLSHMGKKILHAGEAGKGTSLKMLINAQLAESMLIFSENLVLGEKMGFSKDFLLEILPNLPVTAPFLKAKAGLIKTADFETHFPLEWMHKDLTLVNQTASEVGESLPIGELTQFIYEKAKNSGFARKDFSAIYQFWATKRD